MQFSVLNLLYYCEFIISYFLLDIDLIEVSYDEETISQSMWHVIMLMIKKTQKYNTYIYHQFKKIEYHFSALKCPYINLYKK